MEYISKKSCSIWTVCPCFLYVGKIIFCGYLALSQDYSLLVPSKYSNDRLKKTFYIVYQRMQAFQPRKYADF